MRFALALLAAILPALAHAQQPVAATVTPAHANAREVAPLQALAFTRLILLRIDDAMRSGNYTVLRDLAAPSLRETQTSADLAATLAPLRARKIELLAASVMEPVFTQAVIVRDGTEMLLEGYLPTAPLRTAFVFNLNAVAGAWQLASLKIELVETKKAEQAAAPAPARTPAKPSLY